MTTKYNMTSHINQMDEQNVFQNGFDEIDLKPNIGEAETTSDSISNSLSGLCIPKQEPPPNSPLPPPHVDASNTSFLRQALLGECNVRWPCPTCVVMAKNKYYTTQPRQRV